MEDFERSITPEQNKKYLVNFAGFLIFTGCTILIVFVLARMHVLSFEGKNTNGVPDLSAAGTFGDFIGGFIGTIFNLAGALLLFYTLREQRDNFTQERLESKLFEMVKIYRDNVAEIEFTYYTEGEKFETAKGRKVFKVILEHFNEAWEETEIIFTNRKVGEVYKDSYLKTIRGNIEVRRRNIDLLLFARIDLTYLIIFFGVGESGKNAIKDIVVEKYDAKFVDFLLEFAALKPKKESDYYRRWKFIYERRRFGFFVAILDKRLGNPEPLGWLRDGKKYYAASNFYYPDNYEKYYGGHQFRLGHYYRHMFQVINFIDDKFDTVEKKKEHMNFFRAQISTFEQYVYLFNSLSTLGRVAELEERKAPFKPQPVAKHLISKYNILRNIPNNEVMPGVRMLNFYPNIDYEAIANVGVEERRRELGYD